MQQTIEREEKILGCFVPSVKQKSSRFYFLGLDNGDKDASSFNTDLLSAIVFKCMNYISLREVLSKAEGNIVTERPIDTEDYVDLSLEGLEKTTILELFI